MNCDGSLILPLSKNGKITSLQFINESGEKRFLPKGEKGNYLIGNIQSGFPICVAEGFATAASIYESTSYPTFAAIDAGNLLKTAEEIRTNNPHALIIICADLDISGTGQKKATEAALAIGGLVAVPYFGENKPDNATDFNDLARLTNFATVKSIVDTAIVPTKPQSDSIKSESNLPNKFEPELLRAKLPPAKPYPADALGELLGNAAIAINETVMAPLAMCCQSLLAAASLAAQAHFDIMLPWGEQKPLSLFLLTVGESGERKSGVDNVVLGAVRATERMEIAKYSDDIKLYQAELEAWTYAADSARKSVTVGKKGTVTAFEIQQAIAECGDKPTLPIMPICFMTDPTVEGMYKQFVTGKPSVALFSDEGGLLIGGNAFNSENNLKTIARFCKLWDGSSFDRVRASDGAGVLYGRRMAFHQLAQPEVMNLLLSDRMANGQGLLARCLVAWPESTIGKRHINGFECAEKRPEVKSVFDKLKILMETQPRTINSSQELSPIALTLSEQAKKLAIAAINEFENLMAPGAELAEIRDRASKAIENACRIAGVLIVIEKGLSIREITTEYLERSLILMQWYLAETLRIRCFARVPQSIIDAETLSSWLLNHDIKQFRSKQILNKGPTQLRDKSRLSAAINELVTNGYLIQNEKGVLVDGVNALKSWRVIHYVV